MVQDPNRYYVNGRAMTLEQAIKARAELKAKEEGKEVETVIEPIVAPEATEAPKKAEPILDNELELTKLEYEEVFGEKPHHMKKVETLRAEIAKAEPKVTEAPKKEIVKEIE